MMTSTEGGKRKKITTFTLIIYAIGNLGWSLGLYGVNNLLNYFYMPNIIEGKPMFTPFIYKGSVLMQVTVIGLIIAGGRIVDSVTDPIIAGLSDRSKSKFGKRRIFMAIGALPFAVFSVLAFMPPFKDYTANALYLAVVLFLYYLLFTVYTMPCSALVSELGHNSKERLNLSTFSSIGWALGFAIGNTIYLLQSEFENMGYTPEKSFQISIIIFAVISVVAMYMPVIFIDERKYSKHVASKQKIFIAMKQTLKNRNFKFFLLSELTYWFALTFCQTGMPYYVVSLLNLDKSYATYLMTLLFIISFLFYIPINIIAKKIGKRKTEIIGFAIFSCTYIIILVLGKMPLPMEVQGIIVAIVAAIPMGIFGIIPFAIIADIAEMNGIITGNYKAGIFYAMRGLFMKIGTSIAGLIFPSIIILGTGEVNPFGIRLTGVFGLAFCILGLVFILFYNEKQVNCVLNGEK